MPKDGVGQRLFEQKARQIADEQETQDDYERGCELFLIANLACIRRLAIECAQLEMRRRWRRHASASHVYMVVVAVSEIRGHVNGRVIL